MPDATRKCPHLVVVSMFVLPCNLDGNKSIPIHTYSYSYAHIENSPFIGSPEDDA